MTLRELFAEILPGNRLPEQTVSSVTCDSRQVRRGSVFVCIRGSLSDGHSHVAQALERGAQLIVAQQDCGLPNQILVQDTRKVYSRLCAAFFGHPARRLRMIAVTGTNGKTTTAWLIHHALCRMGKTAGLIGTVCNRIGETDSFPARYTTPDAWELNELLAQMVQRGCTDVVLEASSHAMEQKRLEGCRFACGIFTNLTPEHLDYHPDMEHYYRAKRELFCQCDAAVVHQDDAYGRRLMGELTAEGVPVWGFGTGQDTTLRAEKIELFADRCQCSLCFDQQQEHAVLPLPGTFSVENLLAAVAALLRCGFPFRETVRAVCSCEGVPGRTEVCVSRGGITVLRDYAHTPDSLEKVLTAVREFCTGRVIAVFGCPGRRDRQKRPLMAKAVCDHADFVVMTADNPREEPLEQIFADAMPGLRDAGKRAVVIPDRRQAILCALQMSRPGDTVLLAGKGHEDYQVLKERTICFDEKQIARELFEQVKGACRTGGAG
jgi:UDP-N-acetylmuramoyl-L-alanyl-D-glutamate--2,6-diaminopimelate ligase